MDEAMVKETLTGAFADIIQRIWSGHYTVIHPGKFKSVLGSYHPQFKDFRQVSFLQGDSLVAIPH